MLTHLTDIATLVPSHLVLCCKSGTKKTAAAGGGRAPPCATSKAPQMQNDVHVSVDAWILNPAHRLAGGRMDRLLSTLTGVLLLLLANPAQAWNRGGHLVSGALTWRELGQIGAPARDEARRVLESHPAYAHWQSELSDHTEVDRGEALFMLAAAWPDDVRRGQFKRFDQPTWHYVNFAYTPGKPLADVLGSEPFNGQLLSQLLANLSLYRDRNNAPALRAVALSWVLHLGGDITQPLHVTALVNPALPDGDRGGNDLLVRASERSKKGIRLHKIWDDGATGTNVSLTAASHLAIELASERTAAPTAATIASGMSAAQIIRAEAASSYAFAVERVYLKGALEFVTQEDADAPLVPEGYTKQLKALSRDQMRRAGRLGAALLR